MISFQTNQRTSKSIARARTAVRIVRVFFKKENITVVVEVGRGGDYFKQNYFPLALSSMMMSSVSRAGHHWNRWPSRESLPNGRCCCSNECRESTATALSSNYKP